MPLTSLGVITIPNGLNSDFDHAAFDPKTRRIFIAHTARDCLEVIDHDRQTHVATLPGFPGVAGAASDDGQVLTTNRGAATITWLDAATYNIKGVFPSGPRPNGAAILKQRGIGIVACIGDAQQGPTLQVIDLKQISQRAIDLPGRPRWCVTDAAGERIFVCIREPSMILTALLPDLADVLHWPLPCGGAHGLDIDHSRHRLYAACDDGDLVEVDSTSGKVMNIWPIAGPPDVTFLQSRHGPSACGNRRARGNRYHPSGDGRLRPDPDGRQGPYDRDRRTGPALCDFSGARRPSGILGRAMTADQARRAAYRFGRPNVDDGTIDDLHPRKLSVAIFCMGQAWAGVHAGFVNGRECHG